MIKEVLQGDYGNAFVNQYWEPDTTIICCIQNSSTCMYIYLKLNYDPPALHVEDNLGEYTQQGLVSSQIGSWLGS